MKNEQSNEYKFLREFDEIVPGMIFEHQYIPEHNIIILSTYYETDFRNMQIRFTKEGDSQKLSQDLNNFTQKYKLIYDPRNKSKEDIQKEICQKESELASLKEKLKDMNKFKFVKGKFYKVRFDGKSLYGYFDGNNFNNFGNVYWVHRYDTYTDISNGNLGEKLEYVYEVLGNPTLSELAFGNFKTTNNLINEDS